MEDMERVVVRGLVKKPEFNNHLGTVKKAALESGDERVSVTIEGVVRATGDVLL